MNDKRNRHKHDKSELIESKKNKEQEQKEERIFWEHFRNELETYDD